MKRDDPPAVLEVKERAHAMLDKVRRQGNTTVKLANCLEQLSVMAGYRNWNTYSAVLRNGGRKV